MTKGFLIENDPEDITGGYLLKLEKAYRFRDNEQNGFVTDKKQSVVVKEPSKASKALLDYIGNLFNDFHNAINQPDGIDPRSGKHYTELADLDSLCIKFWIEEISRNPDANDSSQFFYKDSDLVDGKLYAGPVWDYDLAYANSKLKSVAPNGGYLINHKGAQYVYCNLYKQPDFAAHAKEIYFERMQPGIDILIGKAEPVSGSPLKSLEAYKQELSASAKMNAVLWKPKVSGMYMAAAKGFDKGVDFVANYIRLRGAYLSSFLSK